MKINEAASLMGKNGQKKHRERIGEEAYLKVKRDLLKKGRDVKKLLDDSKPLNQ